MKKQFKALVFAGFLTAVLAGGASAQDWCYAVRTASNYFQGSYSPYNISVCHGWNRGSGSNHVIGANKMFWNQSGRNAIQGYVAGGRRYNHDMTDETQNLSAAGEYATNFPDPYIDFDDDGIFKNYIWEEWEVTVQGTSFPVVGREYYIQFWSWWSTGSNSGYVEHTPGIAEKKWNTSDLWDAFKYDRGLFQRYSKFGNSPIFEQPSKKVFNNWKENENEKRVEHRKFIEPLSLEEFTRQTQAGLIKEVKGFALEYEVDTEDGPQIVTVGLVPTADELVPNSRLEEILRILPDTYKINRLRGVVSYYFDAAAAHDQEEK